MSNILIADPNPTMRRTLADNIRGLGHSLFEVDNGASVLKLLADKKMHVLFLDVEILEQDESNLIAEAKKISPATSILIVIGLGEDGKKWSAAGAFATVTKPFNVQAMRRIINEAIQNSKSYVGKPSEQQAQAASPGMGAGLIKKLVYAGALLLVLAAAVGAATYFFLRQTARAQVFSVPHEHVSSVISNPEGIWLCDWFEQAIFQYGGDAKFSMKKRTDKPELHPSSLAWDGKNIWSYSSWERRLVKHKMAEGLPSDVEYQIPEPIEIGTLCYGNGAFWIYDIKSARIGKLLLEGGGAEVKEWYAPISRKKIVGLFWEEDYLWCADESGLLYKQILDHNLTVDEIYSLPAAVRNMQGHISFFLKEGKKCWAGAEGAKTIVSFPWKSVELYKE